VSAFRARFLAELTLSETRRFFAVMKIADVPVEKNELQKPRPFSCKVAGQRPMTSPLRMTSEGLGNDTVPRVFFSNLLRSNPNR